MTTQRTWERTVTSKSHKAKKDCRTLVLHLGNEVVAREGKSVGVGVAHTLDRSVTAAVEVGAGQRSGGDGVVDIRHLAVEVSVHCLKAIV